jgi:hypothetical protein
VDGEDAVLVAEVAEVELDGLDGEEVGGDGVAAEGVEGEDVEALRAGSRSRLMRASPMATLTSPGRRGGR